MLMSFIPQFSDVIRIYLTDGPSSHYWSDRSIRSTTTTFEVSHFVAFVGIVKLDPPAEFVMDMFQRQLRRTWTWTLTRRGCFFLVPVRTLRWLMNGLMEVWDILRFAPILCNWASSKRVSRYRIYGFLEAFG